jgi:UDP-N-acetylmuramoylalanine--D-glutamate ligase
MLEKLGINAFASGNIGIPPSFILADDVRVESFVMELSSYQLDFSMPIKNRCSVFTSFSEDHMERHKDMKSYFLAKWRLVMATETQGLCIMPRVIVEAAKKFRAPIPEATLVQVLIDREKPLKWSPRTLYVHFDTKKSLLKGDGIQGVRQVPEDLSFHNKLNLIYSILAVQSLRKTPWDRCLETLSSYCWLPYRFEKIGTWMGHPIFNDSKSTNVESTIVALESVHKPCILLLGGFPKGESYRSLSKYKSKIGTLITFGAASAKISEDLESLNPHQFTTLKDALQSLPRFFERKPGPIVFSPACSSFDEFKNFEERGEFFNRQIRGMVHIDDKGMA